MKRLTALLMSLALALGLAGCSAPSSREGVDLATALVDYSSATGNTGEAAGYIAGAIGADVFEIVPADPYTSEDLNWNNSESRVSVEHAQKEAGTLQPVPLADATPDNWDSYDTVFIGYPIWWFEAAWPVESFVRANDFTGKTVSPSCPAASASTGACDRQRAEPPATGDWLEGQRFPSGVTQRDVEAWLDQNGL